MLDLTNFTKLAPPATNEFLYIKVTDDNSIMLSNKMLAKTPMKFAEIYFSPDRKQIVIIPAKENALKVKNNGYVRTDKASQYLEEAKIRMPAKYTSEWSEEDGAWICTYSGDYFPERAIKNTPMPKTAKKKKCAGMAI